MLRSNRRFSLAPLPQRLEKRLSGTISIEGEIEQSRTKYFGPNFFGQKTRLRAINIRQPDSTIDRAFAGCNSDRRVVQSPASLCEALRARPTHQYSNTPPSGFEHSLSDEALPLSAASCSRERSRKHEQEHSLPEARSSFSAHLLTALSASQVGSTKRPVRCLPLGTTIYFRGPTKLPAKFGWLS